VDTQLGDLLTVSAVVAVGFLGAVAFYESLSTRDVLVGRAMRLVRGHTSRTWITGATYAVTVGVGIPLLVILWTAVLELGLIVVGSVERLGNVAAVAVAVVAAARILAYVRERTSHELAKAIPLAFAFVLLTGGAANLQANIERLIQDPRASELTSEMIVFLLVLEIGLRLLTDGSHVVLARLRTRRGVHSDLGVWQSLGAAIGRPLAERDDTLESRSAGQ
jgi:hypothetical protein